MPTIPSYLQDATMSLDDKVLGVTSSDGLTTKTYSLSSIQSLFSTSGVLATIENSETLQNKTMNFSTGGNNTLIADAVDVIFDNAGTNILALDVQAAIEELDNEMAAVESNKVDTSTYTTGLAAKQDKVSVDEVEVTSSLSIEALSSGSAYIVNAAGGSIVVTVTDVANSAKSIGDFIEFHIKNISNLVSFTTSGVQQLYARETELTSLGYLKLTKIANNEWSLG